ncbi:hypothetical protein IAT38_005717 [Cryptococcus sp. DSM 104549]
MATEDIIPTLILIGIVFFLVRWFRGPNTGGNTADGGIRGVTPAMVETVHQAFPHVPIPNIVYHLSRTRSAQSTSEVILDRGDLPAPPPTFNIPASLIPTTAPVQAAPQAAANTKVTPSKPTSLIDRYNLTSRVPSHKGKEKEVEGPVGASSTETPVIPGAGDKNSRWEDSKEKREMGLKERKEKMILEARRRLLEKEAMEKESAAA